MKETLESHEATVDGSTARGAKGIVDEGTTVERVTGRYGRGSDSGVCELTEESGESGRKGI